MQSRAENSPLRSASLDRVPLSSTTLPGAMPATARAADVSVAAISPSSRPTRLRHQTRPAPANAATAAMIVRTRFNAPPRIDEPTGSNSGEESLTAQRRVQEPGYLSNVAKLA